jgi:hypothetical protein
MNKLDQIVSNVWCYSPVYVRWHDGRGDDDMTMIRCTGPECPICESGIAAERKVLVRAAQSKQVRFPKSKGKRIQKKWSKDKRNWGMGKEVVAYIPERAFKALKAARGH